MIEKRFGKWVFVPRTPKTRHTATVAKALDLGIPVIVCTQQVGENEFLMMTTEEFLDFRIEVEVKRGVRKMMRKYRREAKKQAEEKKRYELLDTILGMQVHLSPLVGCNTAYLLSQERNVNTDALYTDTGGVHFFMEDTIIGQVMHDVEAGQIVKISIPIEAHKCPYCNQPIDGDAKTTYNAEAELCHLACYKDNMEGVWKAIERPKFVLTLTYPDGRVEETTLYMKLSIDEGVTIFR